MHAIWHTVYWLSLTHLSNTFDDPRDADEAMYGVRDGVRVLGRDLDIEFAKGDRKGERWAQDIFLAVCVGVRVHGCV